MCDKINLILTAAHPLMKKSCDVEEKRMRYIYIHDKSKREKDEKSKKLKKRGLISVTLLLVEHFY